MKKFFLTVCCLMVASVAMAQSDTVANVKNVYVTQDADRGRILLTVGGYQVGLTSRTRPKYAAAGTVVMSEAQVERLARQNCGNVDPGWRSASDFVPWSWVSAC